MHAADQPVFRELLGPRQNRLRFSRNQRSQHKAHGIGPCGMAAGIGGVRLAGLGCDARHKGRIDDPGPVAMEIILCRLGIRILLFGHLVQHFFVVAGSRVRSRAGPKSGLKHIRLLVAIVMARRRQHLGRAGGGE